MRRPNSSLPSQRTPIFFAWALGLTLLALGLFAAVPPAEQAALDRITAASLRSEVSYLASDELQGRLTPSRGLELAADFIAARFREAGLDPAAAGSFFQEAKLRRISPQQPEAQLRLEYSGGILEVPASHLSLHTDADFSLSAAPIRRLPSSGEISNVSGQVVADDEYRWDDFALARLSQQHPRLILLIGQTEDRPQPDLTRGLEEQDGPDIPIIRIHDSNAMRLLRSEREVTVSLRAPETRSEPVVVRNVAGLLHGSDPVLSRQYILVTAHYDHLGAGRRGIFHGANDNASGTASVMEIAAALAALPQHPKRSILFIAFFGEEEGLLGSTWYANHPLEPLKDTVADINLEQMGRTDERTGRELGAYAISGPSYSNLPAILAEGAKEEGVATWTRRDADNYFDRSDNFALARRGIIAHTVAVAFDFPGYHSTGDTVDKIDFANMASVDRGIAAGVLRLANQPEPPKWTESRATAEWRGAGK